MLTVTDIRIIPDNLLARYIRIPEYQLNYVKLNVKLAAHSSQYVGLHSLNEFSADRTN